MSSQTQTKPKTVPRVPRQNRTHSWPKGGSEPGVPPGTDLDGWLKAGNNSMKLSAPRRGGAMPLLGRSGARRKRPALKNSRSRSPVRGDVASLTATRTRARAWSPAAAVPAGRRQGTKADRSGSAPCIMVIAAAAAEPPAEEQLEMIEDPSIKVIASASGGDPAKRSGG